MSLRSYLCAHVFARVPRTRVAGDLDELSKVDHADRKTVLSVQFAPHETDTFVSAGHEGFVKLWRADGAELKMLAQSSPQDKHTDLVNSIVFSPDGHFLASGANDLTIRLWDARTLALLIKQSNAHSNYVMSVAWAPDGTALATGSWDKVIRVWEMEGLRPTPASDGARRLLRQVSKAETVHPAAITCVHLSADGELVVACDAVGNMQVWSTATLKMVSEVKNAHKNTFMGSIACAQFSPDKKKIVSAGTAGNTIKVWKLSADALKLKCEKVNAHGSAILSVDFEGDATTIRSVSSDGEKRVWSCKGAALELLDTAREERTQRAVPVKFVEVDHATLRLKDGSFYAPSELTSVAVQGPRLVVGAQSGELYHLSMMPSGQTGNLVA